MAMTDVPGVPSAAEPRGARISEPGSFDAETLVQSRLRGSELALEEARHRAAVAEAAGRELSARIRQLEDQLAHLTAALADRSASLRVSEQRAYAEQARRVELEEQLAQTERHASADAESHRRGAEELHGELESLRRRLDEVEHAAAVAELSRARLERERVTGRRSGFDLRAEFALAGLGTGGLVAQRAPSPPVPLDAALLRRERTLAAVRGADATASRSELARTVATLRAELEARTAAEARVRALLATVQARVEARARTDRQIQATLSELRGELDQLRRAVEHESAARAGAPPPAAPPDPSGPVESGRLSAALVRLREEVPPVAPAEWEAAAEGEAPADAEAAGVGEAPTEGEAPTVGEAPADAEAAAVMPAAPRRAWLPEVFKSLVAREPMTTGRLLLQLLPAQRAAYPQPIAYDLIFGEPACVQVTVEDGAPRLDFTDSPRTPQEVRFQMTGDLASIARTAAASRWRRRFGWGKARITGDKHGVAALRALIRAPLTLGELYAAGVRLDPPLALTVASVMIKPSAASGARFTIAHQATESEPADAYIHVSDRKLSVTETPPADAAETTIVCPPDALLLVLAGAGQADATVRGEREPLELLQRWIEEAQHS